MKRGKDKLLKLVLAAMFLALALVLPLFTGQIPRIGKALCPMHLPVLLCGFICGPWSAAGIGFIAPLLRFAMFGSPELVPKGIAMCFELAAYGLVSGLMYRLLPDRKINIYVSLITAMLAGRAVWGAVRSVLFGVWDYEFGKAAFIAGAFVDAIPGIILQLILIPITVMILKRVFPKLTERNIR